MARWPALGIRKGKASRVERGKMTKTRSRRREGNWSRENKAIVRAGYCCLRRKAYFETVHVFESRQDSLSSIGLKSGLKIELHRSALVPGEHRVYGQAQDTNGKSRDTADQGLMTPEALCLRYWLRVDETKGEVGACIVSWDVDWGA